MKEVLLLKYGEIALKGLNRSSFEERLINALSRRLKPLGHFSIVQAQSTLYVTPEDDAADINAAFEVCRRLFGISSLSRAVECEKDVEAIAAQTISHAGPALLNYENFKVECRRADKRFPLTSPELASLLGGRLQEAYPTLKVNVVNPAVTVYVEVRDFAAYVHVGRTEGAGGLPPGCGGRAALLLSGGIDSPVAGYMMAKRGIELVCIHFASPPYTSSQAEEKVCELAGQLSVYCGTITLFIVPFTEAQLAIKEKCPEDMATILLRRMMMRVASVLAKKSGCKALITGESLGQVASQTLDGICTTDAVCSVPVFRPLIGMDKEEITVRARKIGTFETSILPYEDCCTIFTPKHPKTKPDAEYADRCEEALDVEAYVAAAADKAVRKTIDALK